MMLKSKAKRDADKLKSPQSSKATAVSAPPENLLKPYILSVCQEALGPSIPSPSAVAHANASAHMAVDPNVDEKDDFNQAKKVSDAIRGKSTPVSLKNGASPSEGAGPQGTMAVSAPSLNQKRLRRTRPARSMPRIATFRNPKGKAKATTLSTVERGSKAKGKGQQRQGQRQGQTYRCWQKKTDWSYGGKS